MNSLTKVGALAASLALCLPAPAPAAQGMRQQESRPPVAADAAGLRRALAAALRSEFEIVRDELARRSAYHGGGAYWLAHLRPKRAGHFSVKYTYEYEDPFDRSGEPHTRVERTVAFRVGPRGCRRRPEYMAARYEPCLGDTVILPVALDAYKKTYAGHAFEFKIHSVAPAGPERWEADLIGREDAALDKSPVANPLAEHLKYVGRALHISPHRAPGYTAELYATFEAVRPGRFNLSLGAGVDGVRPAAFGRDGSIPVIVVARGTPVTWLAGSDAVVDLKGRFSSHYGESYHTTPVVMQPGERLTLRYHQHTRRGREAERALDEAALKGIAPVIRRLPFHVGSEESFNEWIVEYLPG